MMASEMRVKKNNEKVRWTERKRNEEVLSIVERFEVRGEGKEESKDMDIMKGRNANGRYYELK